MHKLSVFLPAYNGARFIQASVRSLLAQTYREFELIVLDDASVDGTVSALGRFSDRRLRIVRSDVHRGAAGNWNRAFELAETPYIAICHQDDVYEPAFLGALLALLDSRPDAFIAHCKARTIDERGKPASAPADRYKDSFWPADEPYERGGREELAALRRGSYIVTPSVLYRIAAVREIGLFSTEYEQSIDWNYWLRGVLAGHTVTGTRQRLMNYRRHPAMTTEKSEASLTRYREEVRLLAWVAQTAFAAGLADEPRADYSIVVNTLLSKLARRLTGSQVEGARTLLRFAEKEIPGFTGSARHRVARAACALGPSGGRGLQMAESACFSLLGLWHRLPSPRPRLATSRLPGAGSVRPA